MLLSLIHDERHTRNFIFNSYWCSAIILYNTAVGELNKGNFDLVIDDLKKALSYNEGFTEAIKLMGLCYVNMKEYKRAEKTFKKQHS